MFCLECKELLNIVPLYNNGEDELYPPNLPFCANPKCSRYGLMTIAYGRKLKEEDEAKEGEHQEVQ